MPRIEIARKLRTRETWAEKLLWRWLRDRRFNGHKFRRQHPLGEYILDFYCEESQLNIELDGSGHGHPVQRAKDEARDEWLGKRGIKVIRVWNHRLRREGQWIRDDIFRHLEERAPRRNPEEVGPVPPEDG